MLRSLLLFCLVLGAFSSPVPSHLDSFTTFLERNIDTALKEFSDVAPLLEDVDPSRFQFMEFDIETALRKFKADGGDLTTVDVTLQVIKDRWLELSSFTPEQLDVIHPPILEMFVIQANISTWHASDEDKYVADLNNFLLAAKGVADIIGIGPNQKYVFLSLGCVCKL
ncbi:hypothetical protein L596_008470 [Steinernema carpocapsae]|uniref:Uncharacterized protein n=1 Tax=Steinernema carpocapsae TaxID=34508 RepID=A0A4U5PDN2_STECR|nr:hypothetical protein L596_008470 [Steinernema carpocapsae]